MERTFVMIKPDGLQRGLCGPIIQRFERKGLQLVALRLRQPDDQTLRSHYEALADKPFFNNLLAYVSSGPVVCMCWSGPNAVSVARSLIGATDPAAAQLGTIRGDFALVPGRNVIHGSDSADSAERELQLWFDGEQDFLVDFVPALRCWHYEV